MILYEVIGLEVQNNENSDTENVNMLTSAKMGPQKYAVLNHRPKSHFSRIYDHVTTVIRKNADESKNNRVL